MDSTVVVNGIASMAPHEAIPCGKKGAADSEDLAPKEAAAEENGHTTGNGVTDEASPGNGADSDASLVLEEWEVVDCAEGSSLDDSVESVDGIAEDANVGPMVNGSNADDVLPNGKADTRNGMLEEAETNRTNHVDVPQEELPSSPVDIKPELPASTPGNAPKTLVDFLTFDNDSLGVTGRGDDERDSSSDEEMNASIVGNSVRSPKEVDPGDAKKSADVEAAAVGQEGVESRASEPGTGRKQLRRDGNDQTMGAVATEVQGFAGTVAPDNVGSVEMSSPVSEGPASTVERSSDRPDVSSVPGPSSVVLGGKREETDGAGGKKRSASDVESEPPSKKMKRDMNAEGEGQKLRKSELDKIIVEVLAKRLARWEVLANMRTTDQAMQEVDGLKERIRKLATEVLAVKEALGRTGKELRTQNAGYKPMVAMTRSVNMRVTQAAINGAYQRLEEAGVSGEKTSSNGFCVMYPRPWNPRSDSVLQGTSDDGSRPVSNSATVEPLGLSNPSSVPGPNPVIVSTGDGKFAIKTAGGLVPVTVVGTVPTPGLLQPGVSTAIVPAPRSAVAAVSPQGGAVMPYRPVGMSVPMSQHPRPLQTAIRSGGVQTAIRSAAPMAIRSGIPTATRSGTPTAVRSSAPPVVRAAAPIFVAPQRFVAQPVPPPPPPPTPVAAVVPPTPKINGRAMVVDLTDDDDPVAPTGRPDPGIGALPCPPAPVAAPLPSAGPNIPVEQPKYPPLPVGLSTDSALPAPTLLLGKTASGQITLTWTMDNTVAAIAELQFFEVFACASPDLAESRWMKLDSVQKKPLPMVCTLSDHKKDEVFAFAVRGGRSQSYGSIKKRHGPFSNTVCTKDL